MSARVAYVIEGSIAEEISIEPGDTILSIDGHQIKDILDYQFYIQDESLVMEIKKASGELWTIEIEKDLDEEMGLGFDGVVFDRMKSCKNRCIFCFIDQLPPRMRKTLYVKDDDYRYSFLYGNFITLTNLTEEDWEKIITMRLSPLYVSVHCMNPKLRAKMLNNAKAVNIKNDLQRLKEVNIEVHTQVVLCPGINDGEILNHTIEELASFYPSVRSIGIVPVGLTGYRQKLTQLESFTPAKAEQVIKQVAGFQTRFRSEFGLGLVYLADEFYIKAGREVPPAQYYDDYPQIENGIGLARVLLDDFARLESDLPGEIAKREVYMVTGVSAVPILKPIVRRLNQIKGLDLKLISVTNQFFGGNVSVTGLLTGSDIIKTLEKKLAGKRVIISEVVFKEGDQVLLDDTSIEDIEKHTGAVVTVINQDAESLVKAVLGIPENI